VNITRTFKGNRDARQIWKQPAVSATASSQPNRGR